MTDLLDFENLEVTDDPTGEVTPPEGQPPAPAGDVPLCEECGTEIPWSGRGRKPKRCAEHKARRSATPTVRQPRGSKRADALKALEDDLLREFAIAGKGLSRVMPTAGVTLVARSERTASALVRLAADNPRLLDALETAAKVAPVLDLGETAAAVGLAIMVDAGRINPDSTVSQMFGVSRTWHELNDDKPNTGIPTNGYGLPDVSVPARFEVIA